MPLQLKPEAVVAIEHPAKPPSLKARGRLLQSITDATHVWAIRRLDRIRGLRVDKIDASSRSLSPITVLGPRFQLVSESQGRKRRRIFDDSYEDAL